jgi:hypothetical protein
LANGFIDHLQHTSATANLHNSQITTAPAKPFPACVFTSRSLATALTVVIIKLHALKFSLYRLLYRTDLVAPIVLKITPGTDHVKTQLFHCCSPTVALLRICCLATGTCLLSRCSETALVYPPTSRSLYSNGSTRYSIDHYRNQHLINLFRGLIHYSTIRKF